LIIVRLPGRSACRAESRRVACAQTMINFAGRAGRLDEWSVAHGS
jgi:hypothetical protein